MKDDNWMEEKFRLNLQERKFGGDDDFQNFDEWMSADDYDPKGTDQKQASDLNFSNSVPPNQKPTASQGGASLKAIVGRLQKLAKISKIIHPEDLISIFFYMIIHAFMSSRRKKKFRDAVLDSLRTELARLLFTLYEYFQTKKQEKNEFKIRKIFGYVLSTFKKSESEWHTPMRNELVSINKYGQKNPAINEKSINKCLQREGLPSAIFEALDNIGRTEQISILLTNFIDMVKVDLNFIKNKKKTRLVRKTGTFKKGKIRPANDCDLLKKRYREKISSIGKKSQLKLQPVWTLNKFVLAIDFFKSAMKSRKLHLAKTPRDKKVSKLRATKFGRKDIESCLQILTSEVPQGAWLNQFRRVVL